MSDEIRRGGRREFLRVAGGSAAALALHGIRPGRAAAQRGTRTLKIGYVSPQTGPAGRLRRDRQLRGRRHPQGGGERAGRSAGRASRSRCSCATASPIPNRAAEVASRLILSDKVDLMLVSSTPETTNPVSDQCEANGTPCVSSVCPWQPWFFGRGGKPETGFKSTYHFFWGLEDIIGVFVDMWNTLPTNKVVGALWPNDGDGNAWGDPQRGFPAALAKAGYKLVDPGRYPNLSDDFSAQISAFKKEKVEIVTGVPIPPDWTTFWKQAAQQGFKPKIATVGKALLFPRSVEALGDLGDGHVHRGVVDAAAPVQVLADRRERGRPGRRLHEGHQEAVDAAARLHPRAVRGRRWTCSSGPRPLDDKSAVVAAIKATNLNTIVGPISWAKGPVPNVTKTPLVGGQWVRGKDFRFDMVVVSNQAASEHPGLREAPAHRPGVSARGR